MMKLGCILFLMLSFQLSYSRQVIFLDSLYVSARNTYPKLKQAGIYNEITRLKVSDHAAGKLPQMTLNSQVSYQSDVTGIKPDIPGISIPTASKDQYKVYADILQPIWDGGISNAAVKLEEALLNTSLNQLEVELHQMNEQVAQLFFAVLASGKQEEALNAQQEILLERLKAIESGIKQGIAEKTAALLIQGEILNLAQGILQAQNVKNSSIQVLSLLTGQTIDGNATFTYNSQPAKAEEKFSRPETQFFNSRLMQLENQKELVQKSRNPKLMAFGQAGIGRPGLNMLSNDFEPYFLTGIKLTWNPLDWKQTARQKQVISFQQEVVQTEEETFNRNLKVLLLKQKEEIKRLEKVLETDKQMVALRKEITAATASKLENNTITTADYIREVQAETIAILNLELHSIQLDEAHEKYKLIKGKG